MPDGLYEPIPVTPRPFRPTFPGPPDDGDVITLPDPTPAPEPQPGPTPAPPPVIPEPPSAPTSPGALPDLGWLAALIVLFGLIALAKALVDFFNWLFRRMLGPLAKKSNRTPLTTKALLQPLSNHLGTWEQGIDAHLGLSFQKLASIETRIGRAIVAAAQTGYQVAVRVARLEHHSRVQDHVAHAQGQRIASTQHTARHAVTQAETERKRSVAGEHSIQMQVNALTHHVTHVMEPELEQLRHRIPSLEKGATDTWDEIKKHEGMLSIAGITALTAVALEKLGGSWIRCEANQLLGRANCGGNSDLMRRILANAIPALAAADLCGAAEGVTALASTMQPALMAFVDVEFALIGCHGATAPGPVPLDRYNATPVIDAVAA